MLTTSEIKKLIGCPKKITGADPKKGMKPDNKSEFVQRRNLDVCSLSGEEEFSVFLRKNVELTEQFSIGLQYKTKIKDQGAIVLLRYNGMHGTYNYSKDGHFGNFHIHRISEDLVGKGIYEPKDIELTTAYNTFDQATMIFLNEINIQNIRDYFPSTDKQIEMFP